MCIVPENKYKYNKRNNNIIVCQFGYKFQNIFNWQVKGRRQCVLVVALKLNNKYFQYAFRYVEKIFQNLDIKYLKKIYWDIDFCFIKTILFDVLGKCVSSATFHFTNTNFSFYELMSIVENIYCDLIYFCRTYKIFTCG